MLNNLSLNFKYRSDSHNIHKDFYLPCLENSIAFDRAAGYFSSSSLQVLANGMDVFLRNNGKVRIICNPHLSEEDANAIRLGYEAQRDVVTRAILRQVEISINSLQDETLNVLAWLIYQKQLEIKIAYAENGSLYHEKFGLFYDLYGNVVAFSGSSNETIGGLLHNFEKIDVFFGENDSHRIEDMKDDFESLWSNTTPGLNVIAFPEPAIRKILQKRKGNSPFNSSNKLTPRQYQLEALGAIKKNNWNGILEMATGTGKTFTSLVIADRYKELSGKLFLIIFVPFTHLVSQWEKECRKLGFSSITLCFGNRKEWINKLHAEVRDYNIGLSEFHVVITTYKTASSKHFIDCIRNITSNSMLIADECHYMGVKSFRNDKYNFVGARVGLSATPERWWDDKGSDFIRDFFKGVVYEYSLEDAIKKKALTEYEYKPIIVDLNEEEIALYEELTKKIAYLYNSDKDNTEEIERLQRERSLVLARAEEKQNVLLALLKRTDLKDISHTLVYCAQGQIDEITKQLANIGLRVHRFDYKVTSGEERAKILNSFAEGVIQVLVAIRCLDEGVDVPSTRTAYFLASTSNPREFIQRRGRVLRLHPGKSIAKIYDFIVLPKNAGFSTFESVASKELPRFAEFSSYAINKYTARDAVSNILEPYHLEHLMDKLPWDVYKEYQTEKSELV